MKFNFSRKKTLKWGHFIASLFFFIQAVMYHNSDISYFFILAVFIITGSYFILNLHK